MSTVSVRIPGEKGEDELFFFMLVTRMNLTCCEMKETGRKWHEKLRQAHRSFRLLRKLSGETSSAFICPACGSSLFTPNTYGSFSESQQSWNSGQTLLTFSQNTFLMESYLRHSPILSEKPSDRNSNGKAYSTNSNNCSSRWTSKDGLRRMPMKEPVSKQERRRSREYHQALESQNCNP
ncbi:hypothetical protein AOLI_G00135300 [Acnodon oligacanthus]